MEDQKQNGVDMLFVLSSIKKGIVIVLNSIGRLINFSIINILPLSIFIVIAASISLALYSFRKPFYKSEVSISHIRLDNQYCAEMIDNLRLSLNASPGNVELAKNMNIDAKILNQLQNIRYSEINEKLAKQYSDSVTVLLPFKIWVEVYDNSILPELQKGILNYLESNEYATRLKEIEKLSLEKIELRLISEIKEIDSLKKLINESIVPRALGNGIIMGEAMEPVTVYNKSMDSYERLMKVHKNMELNNSFEVMVDFNKYNYVSGNTMGMYLLIGSLIGYVVGLLFLLRRKVGIKS